MSPENLDSLPPEERIRKAKELLKDLEKELNTALQKEDTAKKKEIETEISQLKTLIRDSEQELSERGKRKEKIPIEEMAKEELEGLSQEGKDMVTALKGIHEKKQEIKPETPEREKDQKKRYEILEETVAKERQRISAEPAGMQYGVSAEQRFGVAYGVHSTKPLGELYQQAAALRDSIDEKGYVSKADERRAEYLTGVVQERLQAAEEGTYSLSEQAARAASLTQMIGQSVMHSYKGKRNQWYQ